ncbi:SH3 domain-containing protein [candidate division KSB1 bacterium]|nr:SH3 domain-containing protein [candidate division KSB1 bacterium]
MANVEQGLAQRAVIAVDDAEIYSLPWVDGAPITMLSKGDTVNIIGKRGEWVKIHFADGRKGWMQIQVRKQHPPINDRAKTNGQAIPGNRRSGINSTAKNGTYTNGTRKTNGKAPDLVKKKRPVPGDEIYRRFGYSFGMGFIATDYTYSWKFVFHSTPKLALEGSFKHVLGKAADSYFIMSNLSYMLKETGKTRPYVTAGMGVINTVPDRSIGSDTVSNMAINYGVGARKYLTEKLSLIFTASQFSIFVGKNISNFREYTLGILVGKFWD